MHTERREFFVSWTFAGLPHNQGVFRDNYDGAVKAACDAARKGRRGIAIGRAYYGRGGLIERTETLAKL